MASPFQRLIAPLYVAYPLMLTIVEVADRAAVTVSVTDCIGVRDCGQQNGKQNEHQHDEPSLLSFHQSVLHD
jgi:hypothetical protein